MNNIVFYPTPKVWDSRIYTFTMQEGLWNFACLASLVNGSVNCNRYSLKPLL